MKELVESLLADRHYNLCNNNSDFAQWNFLINGCSRWLFLEVNLYCFYSLGSWLQVVVQS